jgi:hypothetical protein
MRVLSPFGVLAVVCSSCAVEEPALIETVFDPCAPLWLDVDADAEADQRESVRAGLAMWREDAGAAVAAEQPAGGAARVPLHFDPAGTAFHGYYDDERGEVYINAHMRNDRERSITVAHELGHVFGLFHVDPADRTSLMNPGNTETLLTPDDVASLAALWGACGQ